MAASRGSNWPVGRAPEPRFCGEEERLSVLATYGGQDLVGDPELEEIAGFAAKLCDVPMAMVTVVEAEHQRFLARTGLDAETTPRPTSFCAHAMLGAEPMVVPDAREDKRFASNPLVTGEPHIRFYAGQPLISAEGAPLGALCVIDTQPRPEGLSDLQRQGLAVLAQSVMRRLGQRRLGRHVNLTLEKSERELRRMIDSVPGIAWRADDKGNFTYVNARWKELTGIEPPTTTDAWKVAIHPDDWDSSLAKFIKAVETNSLFEDEWRLRMSDGSYRWVQSRAVPVITEGQPTSWFGSVIDIDKAHRLSEARDLLAGELSHRIKNIFAVVSGLIALRSRNRPEAKEFADDISSAIRALGTAHDYVRRDDGPDADNLQGLLEDLLAPYEGARGERVRITGHDVPIGPRSATPLALIFHELATNAAKYGALGNHDGKVDIEIRMPCEGADEVCVFWRESSSAVDEREGSDGEGFGSRMLRMAIEGQLGGRFSRSFSDDGLDVEIGFPLASLGR